MVGDLVLSRDEEIGEMVFAPVADVFSRVTSEMTVLQLQTEDGITTLRLTPEHPAYVDTIGLGRSADAGAGRRDSRL